MKDVPIGLLAKEYADKHTDSHEIWCGGGNETRLHNAIVKAFLGPTSTLLNITRACAVG
jgi:hypothetical protein